MNMTLFLGLGALGLLGLAHLAFSTEAQIKPPDYVQADGKACSGSLVNLDRRFRLQDAVHAHREKSL